jgi:TPP-dependent pyruvate/acetoin dehydrogenase alpha subunit
MLTHRGKAPELMRGMRLKDLLAGYYAKKEGIGGGRTPTGSHMYGDIPKHIIPMPGVIGSAIPVAVGVGLGVKLQKTGGIVICFFGEVLQTGEISMRVSTLPQRSNFPLCSCS